MGNGLINCRPWRLEFATAMARRSRKSRGSVYAPGERVEYSDGTVMVADAKGTLRRVPR